MLLKNLPQSQAPVGLIAGWGQYPICVAQSLRRAGIPIFVAGIRDHAPVELQEMADGFRWFGIGKLGGYQNWLKRNGVEQVVFAGKIFKERILFHGLGWVSQIPDLECLRTLLPHLVHRTKTMGDDSLMNTAITSFEKKGLTIMPGTFFAPDLLIEEACHSKTRPNAWQEKDMLFGWQIAKAMGGLDIGQSVTVRDQTVLCVEAIEGTDACISRTATVCPRGGFTLVKVAKPNQDERFDMPTIGLGTVERLYRAGGKAILVEAGKTIFVEREAVMYFINRHKMSLVAWSEASVAARIQSLESVALNRAS
jgi:UDP-2,3-diacylglucosamine hydrolase